MIVEIQTVGEKEEEIDRGDRSPQSSSIATPNIFLASYPNRQNNWRVAHEARMHVFATWEYSIVGLEAEVDI